MIHRRDDAMERLDRRDDVVVGQDDALGRAGRAAREPELEGLVRGRPGPRRLTRLPVLRECRVVDLGLLGERVDRGRREAGQTELAWIGGVAAGAEEQVAGTRGTDDRLDR